MPTYEYKCSNCGFDYEVIQSIKAESLKKCPKCGKDTLKKIISGGVGVIFKGSGFYQTDYVDKKSKLTSKKSETRSVSDSASKPETKADTKAETKSETKTETKAETKTESKPKEDKKKSINK
jgi:putative FmdB family regulatory protein